MEKQRCPVCGSPAETHCPVCGWESGQKNKPHQLQPGTLLRGQYVIGRVLGQGGYGITYLGWDRELERTVAIKEFFPNSMVTRDTAQGAEVQFFTANTGEQYDTSLRRFLREARALAKFSQIPEIVGIHSCFEENGTAYMVMEYVRGSNLVRYTQNAGGRLSVEETLRILKPIMAALDKVHQAGIVHRDISPDNIVLEPMGGAKLLDFGAARAVENPDAERELTASTETIVKQGFAPAEQYYSRGGIGPWTDEYALCATVYYCLTGRIPPNAVSRSVGEEDLDWGAVPGLTEGQRAALEKGMSVAAKNRYPSVGELSKALFAEAAKPVPSAQSVSPKPAPKPKPSPKPAPNPKQEKPKPAPKPEKTAPAPEPKRKAGYRKWLFAAAGVLLVVVAGALLATGLHPKTLVMAEAETIWQVDWEERENQPFWGQTKYPRKAVRTVSFHAQLEDVPASAWDVSEAKDRSILAWMDGSDLHVAANGNIAPNPNASCMFAGFTNLQTIDFGGCLDTSGVTDMNSMFFDCSSLTSLDVSGFDTANVTDMGNMFSSCATLTSLDLRGFNTANVTDMGCMFCDCSSITSLDVSGFDTTKVTGMTGMFFNCSSLTSLDLSGFDTANVTNMYCMFYDCSSLTSLDLSSFDTSNVTDMNRMFGDCSSLTSLDLSSFDTLNVTDVRYMFQGCRNLTTLDISGFNISNVTYENMECMFVDCPKLTQLTQLKCTDAKILTAYQSSR